MTDGSSLDSSLGMVFPVFLAVKIQALAIAFLLSATLHGSTRNLVLHALVEHATALVGLWGRCDLCRQWSHGARVHCQLEAADST